VEEDRLISRVGRGHLDQLAGHAGAADEHRSADRLAVPAPEDPGSADSKQPHHQPGEIDAVREPVTDDPDPAMLGRKRLQPTQGCCVPAGDRSDEIGAQQDDAESHDAGSRKGQGAGDARIHP